MNYSYEQTEQMTTEYGEKVLGRPFRKAGLIATVVFVLYVLVSLVLGNYIYALVLAVFSILPILVWRFGYRIPAMDARSEQERRRRTEPDYKETTYYFGNHQIDVRDGIRSYCVEYSRIREICRTEHTIALMYKFQTGLILSPDGFADGKTAEDLLAFLKEKCPNVPVKTL